MAGLSSPRPSGARSRIAAWPDGKPPQQVHLDLAVEDVTVAHEEVVSLGARILKPAEETTSSNGFQVYADPAGHPFCLCWTKAG
jgi:predicted enzyme related to lactoylglutathione lyase